MRVLICDPPEGWKYGFPKAMDKEAMENETYEEWLLKNGYPQELIRLALVYSSYWYEDIDES